MFIIDLVILSVLSLAAVIGLFRGFFREVLSLISWVLAMWISFNFSEHLVGLFEPYLDESFMRYTASFTLLFLVTLLLISFLSSIIHRLFLASGLTGMDHVLGAFLGMLIGAVLISVVIVILEVVGLTETAWWQQARLPQYFQPLVQLLYDLLPLLSEMIPPGFKDIIFGNTNAS